MKTGKTLQELVVELDRQAASKKDYLADTRKLSMEATQNGVVLQGINGGLSIRNTAHQQLSQTLGIPKTYYDKMLTEQPDLLATNVNRWLHSPTGPQDGPHPRRRRPCVPQRELPPARQPRLGHGGLAQVSRVGSSGSVRRSDREPTVHQGRDRPHSGAGQKGRRDPGRRRHLQFGSRTGAAGGRSPRLPTGLPQRHDPRRGYSQNPRQPPGRQRETCWRTLGSISATRPARPTTTPSSSRSRTPREPCSTMIASTGGWTNTGRRGRGRSTPTRSKSSRSRPRS
jgi:hypothetical protein